MQPSWSRLVHVARTEGVGRTWHLLDNGVTDPRLTLLCVHGNPSWSYLWRRILADAPDDIRVVAVDQLDMGFSERTCMARSLEHRIENLCDLTGELGLDGPIVTVAHDWGGPISLAWAQRHVDRLAGLVLLNTAVHLPPGLAAPGLIRLVRRGRVLQKVTVATSAFIDGAIAMSRPRPSPEIRMAFRAPYDTPSRRRAIADFVADIPLDPSHSSAATLDDVASSLTLLKDTPALLMWGPSDRVFSDRYLHDLEARLPHADVHRFVGASHFVTEDADVSGALFDWLERSVPAAPIHTVKRRPVWGALDELGTSETPAVVEMTAGGGVVSFGDLHRRVEAVATGLLEHDVRPGERVALMIPPSIDLTVALYACWRLGAITVLIDAGLGVRGMNHAFAAAAPDHLIGIPKALIAARVLVWPGRRFSVSPLPPSTCRMLGVVGDLETLGTSTGAGPRCPTDDEVAAVVFTSGATGPSKGVVYRHHQLQAQRDALMDLYGISPDDRLVAAFAPFALYGPGMGIASVVPDMDVTAPGTLNADALGDAAIAIDATLVFASPAALANVVKTADGLTTIHRRAFEQVRLLLSAGAPVRASLLGDAAALFPNAVAHTPYGMTEVLPVADISLDEIRQAAGGDGVCVGHPLPTVEVRVSEIDENGETSAELTSKAGVVGEVVVRAPHVRDGYDRLWHTQHQASQPSGWHRTGDVGHLDESGRLWIGGRLGHVITSPHGPITPVAIEQSIESLTDVSAAAAVGIGPTGTQQVVAVVEFTSAGRRAKQASLQLHQSVRAVSGHDIATVLEVSKLPVDRRHNSKVDRTRVAKWASAVLAGGRMPRL